jgi:hypothetical protein
MIDRLARVQHPHTAYGFDTCKPQHFARRLCFADHHHIEDGAHLAFMPYTYCWLNPGRRVVKLNVKFTDHRSNHCHGRFEGRPAGTGDTRNLANDQLHDQLHDQRDTRCRLHTNNLRQAYLSTLLCTIVLGYIVYRCLRYFTSELPAFGSGLRRLPGPMSTLPYVGRVHDVDRMQAWHAFNKFSSQYDGLFACTLGGETHIWVAREDVAQDLLVKHASISSARADLGAYPGVTEDYKYLPLLGYTGTSEYV